VLKCYKM